MSNALKETNMRELKRSVTRRTFLAASGLGAVAALDGTRRLAARTQGSLGVSVSREVEEANVRLVNDFCAAFASHDLAKATSLLADDCAYRVSQTRPPIIGRDAVAEQVKSYIDRDAEFKVHKTVVLGPIVLNERDDIFPRGFGQDAANAGPRTIRIAAGLFFVEDGKIVEWTDYIIR